MNVMADPQITTPITITIYGLVDSSRVDEIRYVGQTVNLQDRIRHHRNASIGHREQTHKARWIRAVVAAKHRVVVVVIATASSKEDADSIERAQIQILRESGSKLTNVTDGGGGTLGYVHSDDARRRIAEAAKSISPETRLKMSAAKNGFVFTDEHRQKLTDAGMRRSASLVTRRRISDALRGRVFTEETKQKLSDARKRRVTLPSTRAKLRQFMLGKALSTETRKKVSDAAKRRWARVRQERAKDDGITQWGS